MVQDRINIKQSIVNKKEELQYLLYLIQIFEAVSFNVSEHGLWGFGPALKCVNKTN